MSNHPSLQQDRSHAAHPCYESAQENLTRHPTISHQEHWVPTKLKCNLDFHDRTPVESCIPCCKSIGTLISCCTSKGALQRCGNSPDNPAFPETTKEEPHISAATWRRPNSPAATREETWLSHLNLKGVLTPLLLFKRYPQIPITTRKEPHVSRRKSKGHWVPPQLKIRPNSPAATWMESRVSPPMKGGMNSLLQLKKNTEFPTSTQRGLIPL